MYSGEYDACDVTLSAYPHCASLKICLSTNRIIALMLNELDSVPKYHILEAT